MLNYAKTEISGFWGANKDKQVEIFKMAGPPLIVKAAETGEKKKPA